MTSQIDDNSSSGHCGPTDASNIGVILTSARPDADRVRNTSNTPRLPTSILLCPPEESIPPRLRRYCLYRTLLTSALEPMAVLRPPVVLLWSAPAPLATFSKPVVRLSARSVCLCGGVIRMTRRWWTHRWRCHVRRERIRDEINSSADDFYSVNTYAWCLFLVSYLQSTTGLEEGRTPGREASALEENRIYYVM